MNFSPTDLKPSAPTTTNKWARFALPLTPFFIDPAIAANKRTLEFRGDDFYSQFKTSGNGPIDEVELFCGFDGYRTFTSVDLDPDKPAEEAENGSITRYYEFDTETNRVNVKEDEQGNPTFGLVWATSPTTATQGVTDNDPPNHIEITLSDPVSKTWLSGEWERWMGESDEFRDVTSNARSRATRSESDGELGVVGGGDALAFGYWFQGQPWGMVGDEGEKWNGKFSTWVNRVQRKNAPVIHQECSKTEDSVYSGSTYLASGKSIYRDGYSEMELSDPVGDLWKDGYGVFQESNALDSFPMSAAYPLQFNDLLYHTDEGEANELTLVSRTGKRYCVEIQTGRTEYAEDGSEEWVTSESHVLTTSTSTLQATLTLPEKDDNTWQVRVARIEGEAATIDGETQWGVIADIDTYEQYVDDLQIWQEAWEVWDNGGRVGDAPVKPDEKKNPATLIGPDVSGDYLLLAAIKVRDGVRFGFTPLAYSEQTTNDRHLKRTFKLHLTPGTVEAHEGACGSATISGSADLEWSEEFDPQTGIQLPREVGQWQLSAGGTDWTQEDISGFDSVYFYGSDSKIQTATKIRREGTHTWSGRFLVAFDEPDPDGKILSSDWTKVSMTATNNKNQSEAVALDPPASGSSLFFEGHRLTYEDET